MRCAKAREWILARRDEPLGAACWAALEAHLGGCAECASLYRDVEILARLVAATPVEEPSPNFDWRLKLRLAKLEREPDAAIVPFAVPRPKWRMRAEFGAAMAFAAAVVVAAGVPLLRSDVTRRPASSIAVVPKQAPADGAGTLTPLRDAGRYEIVPPRLLPEPPIPHSYFVTPPSGSGVADSVADAVAPAP